MSTLDPRTPISRRRALAIGGGAAAGGLVSGALPLTSAAAADAGKAYKSQRGRLPVDQIEQILQAEGMVSNGVLSIDIERNDIGDVAGPLGVTFTPAFEIDAP